MIDLHAPTDEIPTGNKHQKKASKSSLSPGGTRVMLNCPAPVPWPSNRGDHPRSCVKFRASLVAEPGAHERYWTCKKISGPIKQGLSQWGMAQYGLLLQNCRKRQEKTEKDRKSQKETEKDKKRQKQTERVRSSTCQVMSGHAATCRPMVVQLWSMASFFSRQWHGTEAMHSIALRGSNHVPPKSERC